jgi:hypothetical protein
MFVTGARVGQAVRMHPKRPSRPAERPVCIPGAKGHADRWITVPMELVVELANLPAQDAARLGAQRQAQPARVRLCEPLRAAQGVALGLQAAKIDYRSPHAAGRHGFGQEHSTSGRARREGRGQIRRLARHRVDAPDLHPRGGREGKILAAFRTGLVQAETRPASSY